MGDLFNFQATIDIDVKDISAYYLAASLSTVTFRLSTESLDDLKRSLMFKLGEDKRSGIQISDNREKFDEESFREWDCLYNKYLYSFGGGTISYLKAIKSMESSLNNTNQTEINHAIDLIDIIQNENKEKKCYVSLGCGDGQKDRRIMEQSNFFSHYYPVDINCNLIKIAINEVQKVLRNTVTSSCYIGDFTCLPNDLVFTTDTIQKVFFCLGNTIGNYQEKLLLESLYKVMDYTDYAIISFEKQTDSSIAKRYYSPENSDFILNPLRSIDTYSYVRPRYLRSNIVTGLSDIDSAVKSYLFSLGSPNGSNIKPIHIIWTNRYETKSIKEYFNTSPLFSLVEIKDEGNVIVVLLKKKVNDDEVIRLALQLLDKMKPEESIEKEVIVLNRLLKNGTNQNKKSLAEQIVRIQRNDPASRNNEIIAICKKINKRGRRGKR